MSRRVRELVRGGGGRLEREGECCSAAEGRRDDDMLAGSGEVLLLLRSPYALRRAVYAGRFHSLCKRGAGLWLRMQTRRLPLVGPIRHGRY